MPKSDPDQNRIYIWRRNGNIEGTRSETGSFLMREDGCKNEDELRQYVAEYVAKLAATHDTVNTEREFCTTSGRTVQVYSSVYGWKIDQEKEIETIMQEMIAGVQINREPVYAMRANARV